jgi:FkbM family methyltransferase
MSFISSLKEHSLYNVIRNACFDLIYSLFSLKYLFVPKREVLVYLGLNYGKGFDKLHWKYKLAIGVEANPELFEKLKLRYINKKHIQLVHGAATTFNGMISFNISDNHGLSSSIGQFKAGFGDIKMIKSVSVPAFNLFEYLQNQRIEFITDYVSDIQGNDLEVLKTMKPYINSGKILRITSEVAKNEYINTYEGLPDNSEEGFDQLLSKNYLLISKGWEDLKENRFREVPDAWWEMDCMWKLKENQD